MSDNVPTPAQPATPVTPPGPEKYHFIMVPDRGGEPTQLSSDNLEGLCGEAYKALMRGVDGWCYFIIDGVMCHISQPKQVFKVRKADGSTIELRDQAGDTFDSTGKFHILRSVPQDT